MRTKLDINLLWQRALRQADLDLAEHGRANGRNRIEHALQHDRCPISLDDLCNEAAGFADRVAVITASSTQPTCR